MKWCGPGSELTVGEKTYYRDEGECIEVSIDKAQAQVLVNLGHSFEGIARPLTASQVDAQHAEKMRELRAKQRTQSVPVAEVQAAGIAASDKPKP